MSPRAKRMAWYAGTLANQEDGRIEGFERNTGEIELMTDKELLEMAAKAVEIDIEWQPAGWAHNLDNGCVWNPLTDDGDALRLAVKLGFISPGQWPDASLLVMSGMDWNTATRRAIVRAAAEIGESA